MQKVAWKAEAYVVKLVKYGTLSVNLNSARTKPVLLLVAETGERYNTASVTVIGDNEKTVKSRHDEIVSEFNNKFSFKVESSTNICQTITSPIAHYMTFTVFESRATSGRTDSKAAYMNIAQALTTLHAMPMEHSATPPKNVTHESGNITVVAPNKYFTFSGTDPSSQEHMDTSDHSALLHLRDRVLNRLGRFECGPRPVIR